MAAVVAASDGDALRVQVNQQRVEGGQSRRVRDGWSAEQGRENGFQTRRVWIRDARIDVRIPKCSWLRKGATATG